MKSPAEFRVIDGPYAGRNLESHPQTLGLMVPPVELPFLDPNMGSAVCVFPSDDGENCLTSNYSLDLEMGTAKWRGFGVVGLEVDLFEDGEDFG
jgi:hypothetical protein